MRAGVLLPLRVTATHVRAIATLRVGTLRHGGEVCFPGGRPDEADGGDLARTALREAREELGLERVELLGRLSSMPVYTSDFRLVPHVGLVDEAAVLAPEPREVAAVLELDVEARLASGSVEAIAFDAHGIKGLSPVFRIDDQIMFGATAHTFYELLIVLAPALGHAVPRLEAGDLTFEAVMAAQTGE
ncbi:MAG: CoA pyrophosphatase [Myxococcales bacterium]|nr:CoA pyrophosphatase [Myxococcales bacterium]